MELNRALTIEDLEDGAILERLEHELVEVLKDCADVNKVPDSIREINLKVRIKPDFNRCVLTIGIETGSKLGKRHPILAKAFLDENTGQAFEPKAKEIDMFPENQGNVTVIGSIKKESENG